MGLLSLVVACRAAGGLHDSSDDLDGQDTAVPEPSDTGELLPTGCTLAPERFSLVNAATTRVGTVVRVDWKLDGAGEGRVWFEENGVDAVTPYSGSGSTLLRGLGPSSQVRYRVEVEVAGESLCSSLATVQTEALPAVFPTVDLLQSDPDATSQRFVAVPLLSGDHSWATILDYQGRAVWFYEAGQDVTRVALARDGSGVFFNMKAYGADDPGYIRWVSMDGAEVVDHAIPGIHTDFVELPDGTLAALAWVLRSYDDGERTIIGDGIVELSPAGEVRWVWNVFDWLAPDLEQVFASNGFYPAEPDAEDWTHANSLHFAEGEDAYYLTFGGFQGLARVPRSGGLTWLLAPQFELGAITSGADLIQDPHSLQSLGDGRLLLFNRNLVGTGCSHVREVAFDQAGRALTGGWSWDGDACLHVSSLGEARRLGSGNTLVVWSSAGRLEEVNAQSEILWLVTAGLGTAFGFVEPVENLFGG